MWRKAERIRAKPYSPHMSVRGEQGGQGLRGVDVALDSEPLPKGLMLMVEVILKNEPP